MNRQTDHRNAYSPAAMPRAGEGRTPHGSWPGSVGHRRSVTRGSSLQTRVASLPPERRKRVLVVDDNDATVEVLALLIERMGFEVQTALDGWEAIGRVESFQPGLVLMDLSMPNMDGFEAAERLLRKHQEKAPVLVAVSGWNQPEDQARAFAAGFDLYVEKPVTSSALRELMDEMEAAASADGQAPEKDPT